MKKKVVYIKCPRCDLNFIDKKSKLCNVCKAELNLVSPSILIPDEDSEEILCPRCHENFITPEEEMCYECYAKYTEELTLLEEDDVDDDWKYVVEVTDDPLPIDEIGLDLPEELEQEFAQDAEPEDDLIEEEVEEFNDFDDDFDDDFEFIDDDDFLEDDEEDEEEDDDEFFDRKKK